jgi:hypothetical protein
MVKREVYQALARFGAWLTSRGAQVASIYLQQRLSNGTRPHTRGVVVPAAGVAGT